MENATAATAAPAIDSLIPDLTAAFQAAETIDNSPEVEEPVAPPEEPAAEPQQEETVEPVEQVPVEDAEESVPDDKFLTAEEIETQFARSNTKGLRALAAKYSVAAQEATQKNDEILTQLGGEPFIAPLGKIASALHSEDADPAAFQTFFEGIADAAGDKALLKVLGQSIYMGFVQSEAWRNNPATKEFGQGLHSMIEDAVQQRFGVPLDRLAKSAEWDKIGLPDKFQTWVERYGEDPDSLSDIWDEFEETLQINNNPKLKALAEENAALKRQKEAEPEVKSVVDTQVESRYNEYASLAVETVLDKVMWKDSPLKDLDTDTPEIKEYKGLFRTALANSTVQALQKNPARDRLLAGFREGKQQTAVYQTALTTALDEALKVTSKDQLTAEKILTALYGKTRNAKLVTPPTTNGTTPPPPQAPTVPTNFAPPAGQVKDKAQIVDELTQAFADFDAKQRG